MQTKEKKQIQVIQAFRGIAAVAVMLFHKQTLLNINKFTFGTWLLSHAAIGVDLFFIISGFIMLLVTSKPAKKVEPPLKTTIDFWIRRSARIMPVYIFVTILFGFIVWNGFSFFQVDGDKILRSLLLQPISPSKEAPYFGYTYLIVGWTLNYEMFFYLLFGLSLMAGTKKLLVFTLSVIFLQIILPLILTHSWSLDAHHHYPFQNAYLNLITNPIIWEFFCGILVAYLLSNKIFTWNQIQCKILMWLSLLLVLLILLDPFISVLSHHGIVGCGIPLMLMVYFYVYYEMNYGMKIPGWLLFLGKISFSIYLFHPLAQYLVPVILKNMGAEKLSTSPICLLFSSIVTIMAATISQKYLETKLSNFINSKLLHYNALLFAKKSTSY